MAKNNEAQGDDQVDGDEGMGEFEEEGTADIIRKILDTDTDDDDDGGLDQPSDGEGDDLDVVSPEKGQKMVEDAETKRERDRAKEAKAAKGDKTEAEGKDADAADKGDDKAAAKGDAGKEEEAPGLDKATVADLVKEVPEAQRAELTRRLGEAEKINALFAGREEEMKIHGLSGPSEVISRLMHLNSYAQTNPGEYIAWVAQETGGEKAHEALSVAAAKLGFKLQKAEDDDDDPFMTDKEREQAAEIKRLTAGQQQATGPLAPDQVAQQRGLQMISDLKSELDPKTGQQVRPYWGNVEHLIAQQATAHRQTTNTPPTRDDLARFYDAAIAQMQGMFGNGGNSAAQPDTPVAQTNQQAASVAKSRAASKTIDGTGQGASRRPALSPNAPIEDVIRHAMAQQEQN